MSIFFTTTIPTHKTHTNKNFTEMKENITRKNLKNDKKGKEESGIFYSRGK